MTRGEVISAGQAAAVAIRVEMGVACMPAAEVMPQDVQCEALAEQEGARRKVDEEEARRKAEEEKETRQEGAKRKKEVDDLRKQTAEDRIKGLWKKEAKKKHGNKAPAVPK